MVKMLWIPAAVLMDTFLAIIGIHIDGPLAVLNGEMVGVHLAVGRRPVAVEHGVAPVKLDSLTNKQV